MLCSLVLMLFAEAHEDCRWPACHILRLSGLSGLLQPVNLLLHSWHNLFCTTVRMFSRAQELYKQSKVLNWSCPLLHSRASRMHNVMTGRDVST